MLHEASMDLMAIAFPFNDPVAVKLGPLAIRWYGLAYMVGRTEPDAPRASR